MVFTILAIQGASGIVESFLSSKASDAWSPPALASLREASRARRKGCCVPLGTDDQPDRNASAVQDNFCSAWQRVERKETDCFPDQ